MRAIRRLIDIIMATAMIMASCMCYAIASGIRIPISTPTRLFGGQYMPMPASNYVDNIVNVGAYYYVYSGLSISYSEAFANIKLPTSLHLAMVYGMLVFPSELPEMGFQAILGL